MQDEKTVNREAWKVNYVTLLEEVKDFAGEEPWYVAAFANISALLYEELLDLNWAGFYIVRGEELILGPFQGKTACIRIAKGKGVCGTAWEQDRIQRVPDVHLFPGHIACDSASNSEIVLPVRKGGKVVAVLDIDSPVFDRFSAEDERGLAAIADALSDLCTGF